jgi:proline-specific peptidase
MAQVADTKSVDGFASLRDGDIWYRIYGSGDRALLALHGGPSMTSVYLEPLARLARGRRVVIYDQLGCGKSDHPDESALWRTERFVEELEQLRGWLGLDEFSILGHSWGGMLAIEYSLAHPGALRALVLVGTPASMPVLTAEMHRLIDLLPPETKEIFAKHGAEGTRLFRKSGQYRGAVREFNRRHYSRVDLDDRVRCALEHYVETPAYRHMWGDGLDAAGPNATWDRTAWLGDIQAPTLVVAGRYDSIPVDDAERLAVGIPNAQFHVLENSSHVPHFEEPELFYEVVETFLAQQGA